MKVELPVSHSQLKSLRACSGATVTLRDAPSGIYVHALHMCVPCVCARVHMSTCVYECECVCAHVSVLLSQAPLPPYSLFGLGLPLPLPPQYVFPILRTTL